MAEEELVQIVVKRFYQGNGVPGRVLNEGLEEVTKAQAEYLLKTFPDWFAEVAPVKARKAAK